MQYLRMQNPKSSIQQKYPQACKISPIYKLNIIKIKHLCVKGYVQESDAYVCGVFCGRCRESSKISLLWWLYSSMNILSRRE